MNLTDLKTIFDMIAEGVPVISTIISAFKAIFFGKSKISEAAQQSVADIANTMNSPERDKLEAERVRAFAELVKSIAPIAFVEYLFYLTKVVSVFGLFVYCFSYIKKERNRQERA